ncbi:MAG: TonB family protein [Terriglobia bacterium]
MDPKKALKLIVKREAPEYPAVAKVNYIQGPVRMLVKVSPDGEIREAHVVVGHPFLAVAALEAIRKWLFRPATTRQGPAEFQTYLDVSFALRSKKLEQFPQEPERDLLRQIRPPQLVEKSVDPDADATLRVRLLVGAEGSVVDATSLAPRAANLGEARESVSHWKFRPAYWGTLPVPWYFDVDVPVRGWRTARTAADPGGQ